MKVIHQIIEFLDDAGMLTDEFYDRLVAQGWIKPVYLDGHVASRAELRDMAKDPYRPYAVRDEERPEPAGTEKYKSEVGSRKRSEERRRRHDDQEHMHERRRVIGEIAGALEKADIAAARELSGLRTLADRLGETSPWMRSLIDASESALDDALTAAISDDVLSATVLLGALTSSIYRFPLTDKRWLSYPAVLRAYESIVSGQEVASLYAQGSAWVLREKAVVTAHEVARSQQRVLESLGRVSELIPERIKHWLSASGHGKKRPGDVEVIDLGEGVSLELVWIPAGTFLMGRPSGIGRGNEYPQHEVTIQQGFWLGKCPVTQAQWKAVMGDNPSYFKGNDCLPVEQVSWYSSKKFIARLNAKEKSKFRLPSEAEWEYASRADSQRTSKWCDYPNLNMIDDYAWHWDNSDGRTHPAGEKIPNAWGLYDIFGNVWEWCEDDWHDNYDGAPDDGSAWVDKPRGQSRVLRGGSWGSYDRHCRAAYRDFNNPGDRYISGGFRISRTQ
ncbi:MAG: formylglycine-generating enzyme family protein [Candidatus Hydrogenedens sp.]|jgi:formylglycine-generating enzyme required for sulfatase activity|nr:formylglycine-generating enzyme family protein [Candidatus Hydrogenedens sp.]